MEDKQTVIHTEIGKKILSLIDANLFLFWRDYNEIYFFFNA